MLRQSLTGWMLSLSLFGGLAFADAPVTSLDTDNGTTTAQVVNSQALLSSLTPEQRIARLENQVQYLSTYNTQLQSLSTQVDALRGQIEDLTHQVQLLQTQVKTLSTPSTPAASTGSSPTAAASTATTASVATTATISPTAEQTAFNQAYSLLTQKKFTQATSAFKDFLKQYPNSPQSSTAHYWLGDLYLAQGMPDQAAKQYKVTADTVGAPKRSAAMLQLATILEAYGNNTQAKQLLQTIIKTYPKTNDAIQAQKRLNSIQS